MRATARRSAVLLDTDGDDLLDGMEIDTLGTQPTNRDTDGGDWSDGDEHSISRTDPLDENSKPQLTSGRALERRWRRRLRPLVIEPDVRSAARAG